METKIRKASIEDKEVIFKFIQDLENQIFDFQKFLMIFDQNLRDQNILYLIATINNEPVGFISVHDQLLLHHNEKIAEIQELYVVPEFRGVHVGQSLLRYAINLLKRAGINQIEVSTNKIRTDAQKFYSANNFIGNHFKYTMKI
jgi:(aminoalkyl)phosphonate N-acetyltransferase